MKQLSDKQLIQDLKTLLASERMTMADFLALLGEVEVRRLYAVLGYRSLFSYCEAELHISADAIYKRIRAARAARKFPLILELIRDGKVHLTAITLLSSLLTEENHRQLLEEACFKTKEEVENLCAIYNPKSDVPDQVRKLPSQKLTGSRTSCDCDLFSTVEEAESDTPVSPPPSTPARRDKIAPLSEERVKVQFTGSDQLRKKLKRAQDVLRHKFPEGRLEDIFDEALEALLEKRDPARKLARKSSKNKSKQPKVQSRRIPQAVRDQVWNRDHGQCQYVSPDGKQCQEQGALEFDHIRPWAQGGSSHDPQNIRLLCRTHNQTAARNIFGDIWMNQCTHSSSRGISTG